MSAAKSSVDAVLEAAGARAERAGVFGAVEHRAGQLVCRAKASAAPASYRLSAEGSRIWVSLVTADRWLSESIEADLMHTADKVEDLLEEELADLDHIADHVKVEHFRSDDLLFTFRTPVPVEAGAPDAAETAGTFLLAYEACFRRLGDMDAEAQGA